MIMKNTPWNPVGGSAAAISSIIEPQNVPEMNIHHQLCQQKQDTLRQTSHQTLQVNNKVPIYILKSWLNHTFRLLTVVIR